MNEPQGTAGDEPPNRTATCACRALKVTVAGGPLFVYACCCLECQRATGSIFAYRAWFRDAAIASIEGVYRTWRRYGHSGRWIDHSFCETCGSLVFIRGEGLPDAIGLSAGCFADPSFQSPKSLYWASNKHEWYSVSDAVRVVAEQQ